MGYTKSRAVLVKILVPTINRSRFFKAMRSTHQPTHPRDMIWVTFGIFIELMFPTAVFAGFQALGLGLEALKALEVWNPLRNKHCSFPISSRRLQCFWVGNKIF